MNFHSLNTGRKIKFKSFFKEISAYFSYRIRLSELAACLAICAVLTPTFVIPIAAMPSVRIEEAVADVEPVNEDLPFWIDGWRGINAKLEA